MKKNVTKNDVGVRCCRNRVIAILVSTTMIVGSTITTSSNVTPETQKKESSKPKTKHALSVCFPNVVCPLEVNAAVARMVPFTKSNGSTTLATETTTSTTTKVTTTEKTTTTTTTTTTAEPTVTVELDLVQDEEVVTESLDDYYEQNSDVIEISEEVQEPVEEVQMDVADETSVSEENTWAYSISEYDYILLCNVVGHEYGSDWVPIEEKAKVAEVVLNRVASPLYPNSIREVLLQPYQFSGAASFADIGDFSSQVTESVKEAVDYQLIVAPNHNYISFWGDGTYNHFS